MEDSVAAEASSSILSIWASINSWFTPTVLFLLLNLTIATIFFISNLPNNHQEPHNHKDHKSHHQNDPNPPKLPRSPSILHRLKSINLYPLRSEQNSFPAAHRQQEALGIAATEYVFNQALPHEHDVQVQLLDPNPTRFDSDPTRFDQEVAAAAQYDDFSETHEIQLPNAETHFVFEHQQTVETVTAHLELDPAHVEDTGFEGNREEDNDELQSLDEVYSRLTGGHVNRTKSDTEPSSGEVLPKLPAKMKKSASLKSAFSHFEEEKIVEARRPATVREMKSAARGREEDDVEVDAKADDFINKFKHQLKLQRIDSIIRYKDMINRGTEK